MSTSGMDLASERDAAAALSSTVMTSWSRQAVGGTVDEHRGLRARSI